MTTPTRTPPDAKIVGPTQKTRILDLLSDGCWHDNRELNVICFAYSQRINEMVKDGFLEVEKKWDEGNTSHWWWRMINQAKQPTSEPCELKMTNNVIDITREYRQGELW